MSRDDDIRFQAYNQIGTKVLKRWHICDSNGQPVCTMDPSLTGDKEVRYVRILAESPSLLAALRECVTEEGSYAFQNGVDGLIRRIRYVSDMAQAAIAKATQE